MKTIPTEYHPLEPFLSEEARVLMLGSFPPPRARWSMEFYYPNPQNDMWRIVGVVFFRDKDHFTEGKGFDRERIAGFCRERGIALSDTARAVKRLAGNASDDALHIVERADVTSMLRRMPRCRIVAATGGKAAEALLEIFPQAKLPTVGSFSEFTHEGRPMQLWRMPSSSRAYPKPIAEKAAAYARMFAEAGVLRPADAVALHAVI